MNKLMSVLFVLALVAPASANCGNGPNDVGNGCSGGDVGPAGPQGASGKDGANGSNGSNGMNGTNGKDGLNGTNTAAEAHLVGELSLRLADTKHFQVYAFDSYGFNDHPGKDLFLDGRNSTYGMKFVIKIGKDYTETLLEAQDRKIAALEAAVARLSN